MIEGYHTHDESLKKCVEDYIGRIEKEGQRYPALKAHAEEKLKLANEEIAQVQLFLGLPGKPKEEADTHPLTGEEHWAED